MFSACVGLLIVVWLLSQSWRGLFVYFTSDDIMNMYWARETSIGRLLIANLAPFTTEYRPAGAGLYRILYGIFGLEPLAFRVVFYALLLCNAWLCYKLGKSLSKSAEIAILGAFLASFHNRLSDIYTNNGTIYDVLCGTFYLATLLYYIHVRERYGRFRRWHWLIFYSLNTVALNAKETAATIPVILLAYEVIFHGVELKAIRSVRAFVDKTAAIVLSTMITGLAVIARFQPDSRLVHNDAYAMRISLRQLLTSNEKYLENLFHLPDHSLAPPLIWIILLTLTLAGILSKSKALRFLIVFILITPLPVNFIPARELYAAYIAVMGWGMFISLVLVRSRDYAYKYIWGRPTLRDDTLEPERVFMAMAMALLLLSATSKDRPIAWADGQCIRSNLCQLHSLFLAIKPEAGHPNKLLFLNDPFGDGDWTQVLLYRLTFNDLSLEADRVKMMPTPPNQAAVMKYSHVFDYLDGRMSEIKSNP